MSITSRIRYWRRVLFGGLLLVIFSLVMLVSLYLSGMAKAKAQADTSSDLELQIVLLAHRNQILHDAAKWTLPSAILGSLCLNLARYKLRKLKKMNSD